MPVASECGEDRLGVTNFELAGRRFGHQRIRRQLLLVGGIQHVRQEFRVLVQIINGVGLGARRAFTLKR